MPPEVRFSLDELRQCWPREGRYRVRIARIDVDSHAEHAINLRIELIVLQPAHTIRALYDSLSVRGNGCASIEGRRGLLWLLHLARVPVAPDEPIDLGLLIGLELIVEVRHARDRNGDICVQLANYGAAICDAPATTASHMQPAAPSRERPRSNSTPTRRSS